jgi:serine/threonine protein phosphatase PrpC
MKWKVTAASARGSSHIRSGLPNQDACEFRNGDRSSALRAVLAVSDGHGGARHFRSHVGSALAANTAIHVLYDSLDAILAETGAGLRNQPLEDAVPALTNRMCKDWRNSVRSDLENNPLTVPELEAVEAAEGPAARASVEQDPVLAYGATLLATAVSDDFVLCLQLGDGDILAVDESGRTMRPIAADDRLVANQTTSLCQATAAQEFRSAVLREFPAMVLVSTDGYANSFRSDADFMKIGADYLDIVRKQGIDALSEELPGILTGASEEGSGDDITLGVLHRVGSGSGHATGKMPAMSAAATAAEPTNGSGPSPAAPPDSRRPQPKIRLDRNKLYWIAGSLILALAISLLAFRYYMVVCCSPPVKVPQQQQQTQQPVKAKGASAASSSPVAAAAPRALALQTGAGTRIQTSSGDKILFPALDPSSEASELPYAEVRKSASTGKLELVNLSDDVWTVQRPGKKQVDPPVNRDEAVTLDVSVKITFRNGVSATVVAAAVN